MQIELVDESLSWVHPCLLKSQKTTVPVERVSIFLTSETLPFASLVLPSELSLIHDPVIKSSTQIKVR